MATSQKKPDITQAIRQEQGDGKGRKKPSQIIYDYMLATTGDQKVAEYTMSVIAQQIQQKIGRLIQFGDTVFWAQQMGRGILDVHIFSQESPQALIKRIKQAYDWAKSKGFQTITTTLTDQGMVRLLKTTGLPFSLEQTVVNDGTKMTPAYKMKMEVK